MKPPYIYIFWYDLAMLDSNAKLGPNLAPSFEFCSWRFSSRESSPHFHSPKQWSKPLGNVGSMGYRGMIWTWLAHVPCGGQLLGTVFPSKIITHWAESKFTQEKTKLFDAFCTPKPRCQKKLQEIRRDLGGWFSLLTIWLTPIAGNLTIPI